MFEENRASFKMVWLHSGPKLVLDNTMNFLAYLGVSPSRPGHVAKNSEEMKMPKQNVVFQEGLRKRCLLGSCVISFQSLKWTPEPL